jgi:hypothetical protein
MRNPLDILGLYYMNPAFVIINVYLHGMNNDKMETRPVPIPVEKWFSTPDSEKLDLIYCCGQNDFYPVHARSLMTGDIIPLDSETGLKWHLVTPNGFKELSEDERAFYQKIRSETYREFMKDRRLYYFHTISDTGTSFTAAVKDHSNTTVFEISDKSIFENGHMKSKNDIPGLLEYLKASNLVQYNAILHHA